MRRLVSSTPSLLSFLSILQQRGGVSDPLVEERVRSILRDIRETGTPAVVRWARDLDGMPASATDLEVSSRERSQACARVPGEDREALERAAGRIRSFHARQKQESWLTVDPEGVLLGQLVQPLERVGIYVPGGKAAYPSTVLMNAIPARLAGVREIIMCSPMSWADPDPGVLCAVEVAGVDRVFRVGGAQAVAAMAYGAAGIPKVDKIVGPGNAYVAAAKRLVFGQVDIDMVAGPSEILVVADGSAPARFAAADLLSQAEHDELASAILLTPSVDYADEVEREVAALLAKSDRRLIARASLERFGGIVVTRDVEEALDIASQIAPEHLELLIERPLEHLRRVRHAGAVFIGPWSPEPMGDYVAGPNHVLPTGGTARFSSPLGVEDFLKKTSVIGMSEGSMSSLGPSVIRLAGLEGLDAHARSVQVRLDEMDRIRRPRSRPGR
jgi:histidinol dehydrogenase